MRLPVDRFAPLAALLILSACGGGGGNETLASANVPEPANGPAADYPMVIGQPFTVDGVDYKPADTMNYDAVGYAAIDAGGGDRIIGAHKTLPLPSYVEVTALDSGKTILVRLERRGPMTNTRLVALSPGALAQLGLSGKDNAPVRVRRVNPPEPERAALRMGQRAPDRMDTPASLLGVLKRKLDQQGGTLLSGPAKPPVAIANPAPDVAPSPVPALTPSASPVPKPTPKPPVKPAAKPPVKPAPKPATAPKPTPNPVPVPTPTPAPVATPAPASQPATARPGKNVVQVATFSSEANAKAAAAKVGGTMVQAGKLWRVRTGPFATPAAAQAALAKAKAAGYSDARIQRAD